MCLDSLVTSDISQEINNRLTVANRSYFGLLNHFKSQLLSEKTKILLYKTLVRLVLTYASETWAFRKEHERELNVFEGRILRRILDPVFENDNWRKRSNNELYQIFVESIIINILKKPYSMDKCLK